MVNVEGSGFGGIFCVNVGLALIHELRYPRDNKSHTGAKPTL